MTKFTFVSRYDNKGVPTVLAQDPSLKQTITTSLLEEVKHNLPPGNTVVDNHPDWIRKSDIYTKESCEASITFIDEGAGYKNALGYYVYDKGSGPTRFSDISDIYIIFPNTSLVNKGGGLDHGDTIKIPYSIDEVDNQNTNGVLVSYMKTATWTFPPGKGIGFVCLSNRWRNNNSSHAYLATGSSMYSSDPVLNPERSLENRHHYVNYRSKIDTTKVVYGVEDIHRGKAYCDHDFNDLVFAVNVSPISAIEQSCFNSTTEQAFTGTILCEDLLNKVNADYDYNDLTLKLNIIETLNDTKIQSLMFIFEGLTRGASLNHTFGVVIPSIKTSNAKIYREVYIKSTGYTEVANITTDIIGQGTDRVPIIQSTKDFLPNGSIWATNTINGTTVVVPSIAKLRIVFPGDGIERASLNNLVFPYNFYLEVHKGHGNYFIYSDQEYTDVSNESKASGITQKKKIIVLPDVEDFRVPLEKVPLRKAYHKFKDYLKGDNKYLAWYAPKFTKTHLLYPSIPIDDDDDHVWNTILDHTINPSSDSMQVISLSINNSNYTWSNELISKELGKHNYGQSDLVDWNDIDDITKINMIIKFIHDYGAFHITVGGEFDSDESSRHYYIHLKSLATNSNRLVHSELVGSNDTIELLSWYTTHQYTLVNIQQ